MNADCLIGRKTRLSNGWGGIARVDTRIARRVRLMHARFNPIICAYGKDESLSYGISRRLIKKWIYTTILANKDLRS